MRSSGVCVRARVVRARVRACLRVRVVCVRVISEDGAMVPANAERIGPPSAVLERVFCMKGPHMT